MAAHTAYDMFSKYKYLVTNLVFSHLGFRGWEFLSDCAFLCSLPSCTFYVRFPNDRILVFMIVDFITAYVFVLYRSSHHSAFQIQLWNII